MSPSCGTITVEPAFDPSAVTASCQVGSRTVSAGDSVTIPIDITNGNQASASYEVDVILNGAVESTISGVVGGSGTASESVRVQLTSPGEVAVDVEVTASEV